MGTDGAALARRYERMLIRRVLITNYFAGALLCLYFFLAVQVFPDPRGPGFLLRRMLIAGLPVVVVCSYMGVRIARARVRRALAWLVLDRRPTDDERAHLANLPRDGATIGTTLWCLALAVLAIYLVAPFGIGYNPGPSALVRSIIAAVLLAIVPWSLSYLFIERSLRPIFAMSVTEDVARLPRSMGMIGRFILIWLGTAGLPISGVVLSLITLDETHLQRTLPVVYAVCICGGIAGIIVMVFTARAILEPLQKVRSALRSIEDGGFDVVLPVEDTAELGELEVGINRAALGLRERERLRELFGHHVGPDVARRAMEGNFGLGGEMHDATAMFVDVIGSTKLPERWTPDEVVATLNDFFACVVRCVEAEGGFVNKFEGDGALCIFGAPVEQPDHAARALRAARSLREELRRHSETVDAAIGISSGEVVAGNVGAANRYEYTIIGDPVNEASRLTDEAKSRLGRLLASDATLRAAAEEASNWSAAGTISLRGRAEPTIAYEPR